MKKEKCFRKWYGTPGCLQLECKHVEWCNKTFGELKVNQMLTLNEMDFIKVCIELIENHHPKLLSDKSRIAIMNIKEKFERAKIIR